LRAERSVLNIPVPVFPTNIFLIFFSILTLTDNESSIKFDNQASKIEDD
jgi:hypothetical protein